MNTRKFDEVPKSKEELQKIVQGMNEICSQFYHAARLQGNHAFIEFTGLMRDYINMCAVAADEGRDFTRANVHTGKPVVKMEMYQAEYLGEKFGCIFQACFAGNEALINAFCEAAFGVSNG